MNLRYITLGLDYETYIENDNQIRYDFQLNTRFICNFFSKAIRKYKFKTDGTFNMLSISVHEDKIEAPSIVPLDVLKVELPFDRTHYEKIRGSEDCDFYLDIFEEGFKKAADFKQIPLDILLTLLADFRTKNCKNEWIFKRKKFKEHDLEITLTCEFTTNYFQIVATANQLSSEKELVKGVIIRTEPDEIIFQNMFKDFTLVGDHFIIVNKFDDPILKINKSKLFERLLDYTIILCKHT
ncbi:hypothetical protein ATE47_01285 [Chryseobacterium sp. IHB B 17019]|uniref:hypothetical protein n=1 Tax=Chryseobacterium sp. IHB B 17019 TaxID=1721091 RepID=UPI000721CEED|nr:hypothetical protein [Chryseobacterium sp. IHB B 17019]ALR29245.1 hypothetical protein ATE47_01285 [Chryseobacterium sp. IHB B 17019]